MANSMDMTNISMNRTDAILDREDVCAEYGLEAGGSKSLYHTVERLGRSSDSVVRYLGGQLASRYGATLDRVLMDWTSMYFEVPAGGVVVRSGYSRDRRPDRSRSSSDCP